MNLFAPQSISADISQFQYHPLSSPHSFLPTSSYRLDPNETFRSIVTSRTTTALIAGKKITQEAAVVVTMPEHCLPRAVSMEMKKQVGNREQAVAAEKEKRKTKTEGKKPQGAGKKLKDEKTEARNPSPKKPLVPRLSHRPKPKPSSLSSPLAMQPPPVSKVQTPQQTQRIRTLVQASVRTTIQEIEKKQALEKAKSEEQLKKRVALEQRAKEIREMNSKTSKQTFSPKYAWGVNPERPQNEAKWRHDLEVEKAQHAQARAKSAEQTEEMRRINKLIREHSRPSTHRREEAVQLSNPPTYRSPKAEEIAGYMRKQQMKRREQSQNEELEKLASEAKRLTRLKMLEAKEKRRLEVHKKKKGKTELIGGKQHRRKSRRRSKQSSRVSEAKDIYLESSSSNSVLASQKDLLQTLLRRKDPSGISSRNSEPVPPGEKSSHEEQSDLQRIIDENKHKIEEYKRRIQDMKQGLDIKEESEDQVEVQEKAATMIQACARMFIERRRYLKMMREDVQRSDSFLSGLHAMSPNPKHSLSFDHPSPPEAGQHLSPREFQDRIAAEERNLHLTLEETEKVSLEKEQLGIEGSSDDQIAILQASRQEDKEQFDHLVREICGEQQEALADEIRKAYEALIERRYDHLNQIFTQQRQATEGILRDIPQQVDLSKQSEHTSFDLPKHSDSPKDSSLDERLENAIGSATNKAIELATEEELAKIREAAELRAESPQARPENPLSFMEMDTPSPREEGKIGENLVWSGGQGEGLDRYEPVAYNPDELRILEQLKDADLYAGHTPTPEASFHHEDLPFHPPAPISSVVTVSPDTTKSRPSQQTVDFITERILETLFREIEELQVTEARATEFDSIPRLSVSSEALMREQEVVRMECAVKVDDDSVCDLATFILDRCSPSIMSNLPHPLVRNPGIVLSRLQAIDLGLIPKDPNPTEVIPSFLFSSLQEARDYSCVQKAPSSLHQVLLDSHQIHDKLIFDAVNEALTGWRNYGAKGVPMPWSAAKRMVTQNVTPREAIVLSTRQVLLWNTTRLGIIPRLDTPLSTQSEEIVQLQREEKLVQDIIIDTMTNDEQWCDYEDEETQVKLDLADMVLESLMSEVLCLLSNHR